MQLPESILDEVAKRFRGDYPSESHRRKSMYRFFKAHQGLSLAILKGRDPGDPLREVYWQRFTGTLILLGGMIASLIILLARFSAYELDEIWAIESMRLWFMIGSITSTLFMTLALVWALKAGAALNHSAYEFFKGALEAPDGENAGE